TDVAGVNDGLRAAQRCERFRTKQTVRVGDQAQDKRFHRDSLQEERGRLSAGPWHNCGMPRYLGAPTWKMSERPTSEREASTSIMLTKRWVSASCSSWERRSRSALNAARTLSKEVRSFTSYQTKCVKSPSVRISSTAKP